MARTDFYNDPNAPESTSIVVAASAFVLDAAGRLLMIRSAPTAASTPYPVGAMSWARP